MTTPIERENNYVSRFFGGPPLSVIFRLVLLSILIGVILQVLGLDPWNIIESLRRLVVRVWDMGLDPCVGSGAICCSARSWWCRSGLSFGSCEWPKAIKAARFPGTSPEFLLTTSGA